MSNQQIAATTSPVTTSRRPVRDFSRVLLYRLTPGQRAKLRTQLHTIGSYCLTTLTVGTLLLTAAYLFLVQLAEGGW